MACRAQCQVNVDDAFRIQRFVVNETEKWGKLVKSVAIKVEFKGILGIIPKAIFTSP